MSVNVLIKKRDQLNQKIADYQKIEKRKITVADIAHKAKILNLPDEFLKTAFEQIALSYQNGVSTESQNANSQFPQGGQS
ncbi:hypothetical protein [Sulfuriferula nivalis]|uniref:Uncharacterized protein n=1 Tax=Sulfuriferula nivalis TaxID=2675298 RepID=A0A809S8A3_9PROT|nr:hypothetical protein [Sulfuriferula nivalis]BBP00373.1 hypothetical protein SFSGTM_10810 [Sulfuriferula nivalis]